MINFLMYIGGGLLFILVSVSILNVLVTAEIGNERLETILSWIKLAGIILVWVWICVKFISKI